MDYPNDQPVGGTAAWPEGLKELVNQPWRVHGFLVNWEDYFFFAGDTNRLNRFLQDYSKLPKTRLEVALHTGALEVKSPWDQKPRDITANWQIYATPYDSEQIKNAKNGKVPPGPFICRLDIWISEQIDLNKLNVPNAIEVVSGSDAKDDKSILQFIADHQRRQKLDQLLLDRRKRGADGAEPPSNSTPAPVTH